ncbi:hypothetical protein CP533_5183 [Ophiocordyceps camponoti-saundersi (nom. inval.)]|nr:hypothetical protein CP533_5183 [Ophiocordyceps camponoti-saundersi (nom. inval.)]
MVFSTTTILWQLLVSALVANTADVPKNDQKVNDRELVARNKTDALAKMVVIDWKRPPAYHYKRIESSCEAFHLPFQCHQSAFMTSERLVSYLGPPRGGYFKIDYEIIRQPEFLNINNRGVEIMMGETAWESKHDSPWIASASVTGLGSITVSREHETAQPSIKKTIRSFGLKATCPGGFECHFETWIFHTTFQGPCIREATIDICVGSVKPLHLTHVCAFVDKPPSRYRDALESEYDYIKDFPERSASWPAHEKRPWPRPLRCSQYYKWAWKTCLDPQGPQFKDQRYCKFTVPIMRNEEPLSTTVFIKENRRGKRDVASSDPVTIDVISGFMGVDESGNMVILQPDQQ